MIAPWARALRLACFIVTMFLTAAGGQALAQASSGSSPVHTGPMPDARFYPLLFRHVLYLHNNDMEAGVAEAQPETNHSQRAALDSYFRDRLGFSIAEQNALLAQAQSWSLAVAPVDAKAHSIIAAIRARTPGGRLAAGEQPPAPPQILVDLQQQKDAITLQYVAHLRKAFGDARFASLDKKARRAGHAAWQGNLSVHVNPTANQGGGNQ
jgi:hypothetical protein